MDVKKPDGTRDHASAEARDIWLQVFLTVLNDLRSQSLEARNEERRRLQRATPSDNIAAEKVLTEKDRIKMLLLQEGKATLNYIGEKADELVRDLHERETDPEYERKRERERDHGMGR